MAVLRMKAGRVPPAAVRMHYWEIGLAEWAPVLALLALTIIAGCILYSKVGGF
jgi:hypothetical protein